MWVTVFPHELRGTKTSSPLASTPSLMRHAGYCLREHTRVCLCGRTGWLIMRCWAICTAHSHRDSHREWWWCGGDSWGSSARGVKLQRSSFLLMACKVGRPRPFERKQGGESGGEGAWDRCEGSSSASFHSFTLLFSISGRKNVFPSPSPPWCLIAGCQIRLHQPDEAGQLEPNSWRRSWRIIGAADDSHAA